MSQKSLVTFDSATKIWSGTKVEPIYSTKVSVGYLLLNILKKTPEKVTQVVHETGSEMTCGEMFSRSVKIVKFLQTLRLEQGDVVGIIATNTENLAPVVFACLTLGLPINPLDPLLLETEIVYMFAKTRPKIVFCDFDVLQKVKNSIEKIEIEPKIVTLIEKVEGMDFVDDILRKIEDLKGFE